MKMERILQHVYVNHNLNAFVNQMVDKTNFNKDIAHIQAIRYVVGCNIIFL